MALASCQKPEIENVQPQEYEYTFLIGNADTKATVGETCVEWENGDKMGVYTKVAAGTISDNAYGNITPGEPATMKVYSNQALAIGDYIYAYYPYNSTNQDGNLLVTMEIPAEQAGKDDMPMVAIPHCVESALDSGQQDAPAGKIKFANLGSVIEFNVYTETDAYADEVVKSVTFEADNALAGAFTFDLTKVNYSDESTLSIADLTETTVVANASDLAVGTKDAPAVVKMVVAPGTYAGNIIVKTDAATYTFPISTAKVFKRSAIKPLGLNFESKNVIRVENAPEAWVLTELANIKTGDQVVIVSTKDVNSYAMSNDNGTSAPSAVEVKYSDNMLSQAPAENLVWSFEVTTDNQYSFYKDSNNWLYCTDANNGVKVGNNSDKLFELKDNYLYHVAQGRYLGVYNSQDWRCYTSINTNIQGQTFLFFVKTVGVEPPAPETLESIAVENPKTDYTVGEAFVAPAVKATYSRGTVKAVTGATFTGYDMTAAAEQTVTVSYTEGEVTATTTYDITVSPAEILVEDGTYVIAVKEDGVYYAASTEENGPRRAYVELSGYSSGDYVSHDSKIVWTIANSGAGIIVSSGEQYWGAVKNGISLVETASVVSVAKSETEGAFYLSADCGSDGVRYLAKNGTYGFGFYAEAEDVYLIPAIFVELPTLETPVVDAVLNATGTGIDVSWTAVDNATSYVVSCTNQADQTVTSGTECSFIDLAAGTYTISVTAKAENHNSATSKAVTVIVPAAEGEVSTYVFLASDLTAGTSYNTGTVNGAIAYKLGSSSKTGTLTFPSGYSEITFYAVGWTSGTNNLSVTNGKINDAASVTLKNNSIASGSLNNGFSATGTFDDTYKYTIKVTDTSKSVVLSLKRGIVWGFEGVPAN